MSGDTQTSPRRRNPLSSIGPHVWLPLLLLGYLIALLSTAIGEGGGSSDRIAAKVNATDVGFARDMSIHHQQAVELSQAILERNPRPEIALLAGDILLGQTEQIGQMHGWLRVWGQQLTGTEPAMSWMQPASGAPSMGAHVPGSGQHAATAGTMPGMTTRAQINRLATLSRQQAERSFLKLMIAHHRGGVEMATAASATARSPAVLALANGIIAAQTAEIGVMEQLLDDLNENTKLGA